MLRRILALIAVLAIPLSLIAISAVPASADETPPALSPTQGPPGTTVTASAADWSGCSSMSVSGWGATLGTTSIDASGAFSLSFTVPSDAALGTTQLQFDPTCTHSTYIPFVTFTVTQGTPPTTPPTSCPPTANPSAGLSKTTGPIGTQFSAVGTGWYPNDTVAIHLPYGSKGLFGLTQITWPADSNGDWQVNITVEKPTPPGTYELIFSQSACGGLMATLNFTVTAPSPPPPPPLPDLFTDKHLLSCTISMTDLAFDLAGAGEAEGAVQAFKDAVHLLNDTGDLADFLDQLRANNYWATLINALIIDKLNDCLIGVQLLLNDTSGQAAIAVAHWIEKNLRT